MAREFKRSDRVGEQIQRILGELLLYEVKDPRLTGVTLTGVKVTDDLYHATVYFFVHGGEKERDEALAGFRSAAGYFRSVIRKQTDLRTTPELHFSWDRSLDEGEKMDRIFRELQDRGGE